MDLSVTHLLAVAGHSVVLQGAAIVIGTFILEDAATAGAALAVQSGGLSIPVALASLYIGIVLGDIGLYGLGRLAAHVPWAARLIPPSVRIAAAPGWSGTSSRWCSSAASSPASACPPTPPVASSAPTSANSSPPPLARP